MKRLGLLLLLALVPAAAARAETTAFINVNVIPMTSETLLRGRTVVVTDGRIAGIGEVSSTPVPRDARVVDGTDRYLLPGLAEMHAHVPGLASADLRRVLGLFVANGVTVVRGMLGQPSHLEMRRKLLDGELLGPRLFTSGPSFNGNSVTDPEQAVVMVREQLAAGYDFLKIHPGLSAAEFDAITRTALDLGLPVAGHVPEDVTLQQALDARMASIDHLDGYMAALVPANTDPSGGFGGFFGVFLADVASGERIAALAEATAAADTWNVPTQTLFENLVSETDPQRLSGRSEMKYVSAGTLARWREAKAEFLADASYDPGTAARAIELRRKLILALHRAGAGLLLGSDAPQVFNVPGFSVHRELKLLVQSGLSPYEALQAGTVYPATFFGEERRFGTIQPGLEADLVLLDANPLDDIDNSRRVHGVMLRGRWQSRQDLDRLLGRFERGRSADEP